MKSRTTAVTLLILLVVFGLPGICRAYRSDQQSADHCEGGYGNPHGTGAQNGSVTLWIVGRDYFATQTAKPDKAGNFTFTIKPEVTQPVFLRRICIFDAEIRVPTGVLRSVHYSGTMVSALQIREKLSPASGKYHRSPPISIQ